MFDHATKIREITEHAGALKEGHFAVDGLGGEIHAEKFFAPSTITENPNLLQELASEFTKLLLVEQPYLRECTTVLTANSNHAMLFGSYVAHALARQCGARVTHAICTYNAEHDRAQPIQGKRILDTADHALIIDLVSGTGKTLESLARAAVNQSVDRHRTGPMPLSFGVLAQIGEPHSAFLNLTKQGSNKRVRPGVISALCIANKKFSAPHNCPMCKEKIPLNQEIGFGKHFDHAQLFQATKKSQHNNRH